MAKQTPGSKSDTGSKYEISVLALFASSLSKNDNVKNYRIFSNFAEALPFDDIVAEVHFKGLEQSQIFAIQVKSGKDKFNVNKYYDGYDKILAKGGLKLGESIRNDRINFWYFCNKNLTKNAFLITRNDDTIELKVKLRNRPYNINEAILDKSICYELFCDGPSMMYHQNFLSKFYLFLNQPDTQKIICIMKNMWNIDNPRQLLFYLENYFSRNMGGLDKIAFENELLKVRLSNYVVTPTKAIIFQHKGVDEWNRLTLKHNITIVSNELHIEEYLFGCMLRGIPGVININEWNHSVDNEGKLDAPVKDRLKTKCFKPETLRDLIIQLWVEDKIPLLLRVDTSLPLLKEFQHLQKRYIIIDSDIDKRYNEIRGYNMSVFKHLGNMEAGEIMKNILISMQGRKPVSLYTVINEDIKLMEMIICLDLISLMKPRGMYLKKDCLDGNNYLLFIIETTNPLQHNCEEYQPTGNNIAIYCAYDKSDECYKEVREDPRFRSYKIFRLRLTDSNKLILMSKMKELDTIQGDEERRCLECFFVDQNDESVYNMENGSLIPVIGEVPIHVCPKYVHRYLHKEHEGIPMYEEITDYINEDHDRKRFPEHDFFKESKSAITVVTGEAGMGKTTLLHSLFRFCDSKYYVLFADLSRYQTDLYDRNPKLFKNPLHFLWDKCSNLPYKSFLTNLYDYHDRLVLILDSFDEIVATCKEQGLELIENLRKIGLHKIIIASRLTVVNLLIDEFDAETIRIERFDTKSDERYIGNWNLNISNLHQIPSELLTNPLYLNMLRTISENEINLKTVNRWNLYESIVNLKMGDYCRQMKPHCLDENEKHNILSYHWQLALQVIFGNYTIIQKLQQKKRPKYPNFIRLGFVTCYDDEENPIFIHYTFAEFFVMQWLIENSDDDNAAYVYQLILENKRSILDMHSEKFPLHKAILYGNIKEVEKLCAENREYLLERDDIGRNILHLAAMMCERDFFRKSNCLNVLLQRMRREGYDLYTPDKITKWTWITYWENFIFSRNLWKDEYVATLEAYLDYYVTHMEQLQYSKLSLSEHFNMLYNTAIKWTSISMIQDLLFLKYNEDEDFLEFRDICLHSCPLTTVQLLNFKLQEENLQVVHLACIYSNVEAIKWHIAAGTNLNEVDIFNCTPLHYSVIAYQNTETVKLLLENCKISSPNAGQSDDTTIIHMSVRTGNVTVMKMLLEKIDVNLLDAENFTPLLTAIKCASTEFDIEYSSTALKIIEMLLEHGANANSEASMQRTPIELATVYEKKDIIELLLKYGVNVNSNETAGVRSLYNAINTENKDITELLLQNGANVNYVDPDGLTPLIYAIKVINKNIVEMLLNHNADVNFKNKYGQTPLYWAIETKRPRINGANQGYIVNVQKIHNSYVNCKVEDGMIPRHNAALEIIEMLLQGGAHVNVVLDGLTPLIHAIKTEDVDIVRMLFNYKADVNFRDKYDRMPFSVAIKTGNVDLVECLLKNGARVNLGDAHSSVPLINAIEMNDKDIVRTLLDHNADVNFMNKYDRTPLYWAIENESEEIIEMLLRDGAHINVVDIYGWTPLTYAIRRNKSSIQTLLNYKADVNSKDELNRSPLYWAIEKRDVALIELLLSSGADTNVVDIYGWTPITYAIKRNKDTIDMLLNDEIDINSTSKLDPTDLDEGSKVLKIIELLLKNGAHGNCMDLYDVATINTETTERIMNVAPVFLNYNDDTNFIRDYIMTPLYMAVETGNLEIVKMLVEKNGYVNYVDEVGFTPLITAVDTGNVNVAKILLDNNASASFISKCGITALFVASFKKSIDMVELLLEHGADTNITLGAELLYNAKKAGNIEIVVWLLKNYSINDGINILSGSDESNTITNMIKLVAEDWASVNHEEEFRIAVTEKVLNLNTLEILLKFGGNMEVAQQFWTKILRLIEELNDRHVDNVFIAYARDYVQEGWVVKFCDIAKEIRNLDIIKILLRNDLPADSINPKTHLTLLQTAILLNYDELVEILLQKGANVNLAANNDTPLCTAIRQQNITVVKILLTYNANANLESIYGYTPLQIAVERNDNEIVQSVLQFGANVDVVNNFDAPFCIAVRKQNIDIAKILLEHNCDVNLATEDGATALQIAVKRRYKEIVQFLLQAGANTHVTNLFPTPLCTAIRLQYIDIIEMLLKYGCDINNINIYGHSPFLITVAHGYTSIAKLLLINGADVNLEEESGLTPLYIAARTKNRSMLNLLFRYGAKQNIKTSGRELLAEFEQLLSVCSINDPTEVEHKGMSYLFRVESANS
ncbi:hypothetical protein Trydic_g20277 [Trypoxylus dichotomus]